MDQYGGLSSDDELPLNTTRSQRGVTGRHDKTTGGRQTYSIAARGSSPPRPEGGGRGASAASRPPLSPPPYLPHMHGALSRPAVLGTVWPASAPANYHMPAAKIVADLDDLEEARGGNRETGLFPYWVLSTTASQYSMGAVSACTGMAVQAAYTLLDLLSLPSTEHTRPFGMNLALLQAVLQEAGSYRDQRHQQLPAVLASRPDLRNAGLHLVGGDRSFVDVSPQDAYRALQRGEQYKESHGRSFAAIMTCQQQSVCIVFPVQSREVLLFDSHSRQVNGQQVGASLSFFRCLEELSGHLRLLFSLEQPPLSHQSFEEQQQYAALSVGQADFLCLGDLTAEAQSMGQDTSVGGGMRTGGARARSPGPELGQFPDGRPSPRSPDVAPVVIRSRQRLAAATSPGTLTGGYHNKDDGTHNTYTSGQETEEWSRRLEEMMTVNRELERKMKNLKEENLDLAEDLKTERRRVSLFQDKLLTAEGNVTELHNTINDLQMRLKEFQRLQREQLIQDSRQQDALRQDSLRQDALRQDALRQDGMRQDAMIRQDAERQNGMRQNDLRTAPVASSQRPMSARRQRPAARRASGGEASEGGQGGTRRDSGGGNGGGGVTSEGRSGGRGSQKPGGGGPGEANGQRPGAMGQRPTAPKDQSPAPSARQRPAGKEAVPASSPHFEGDRLLAQRLMQEEEARIQAELTGREQTLEFLRLEEVREAAFQSDRKQAEDLELFEQYRMQSDADLARELSRQGFECPLCAYDVHMSDQFEVHQCGHTCCRECAKSFIGVALRDKKMPVPCWMNCPRGISETEMFSVIDDEEVGLYMELSRMPVQDPGFRPCIEPNCKGFYVLEALDGGACQCCMDRSHRWCSDCQVNTTSSQHANIECEQYQRWREENDTGDEAMEKFLRDGLHDANGDNRMRRCPNCQTAYMKDDQCSHVTCEKKGGGCGRHFCFRCANFHAADGAAVYLHQKDCYPVQSA